MTRCLLTLNAGSSSLKFALFGAGMELPLLASGQIDGLGSTPQLKFRLGEGGVQQGGPVPEGAAADHASAVETALATLATHCPDARIEAVGHRVVHGGPEFAAPLAVTGEVEAALAALVPLAPLHQPHNLAGIAAARHAFPNALQVACFDTAFHRTHPWVNDTFALPRRYYEKGIRRYGFHGLSYEYVAARLRHDAPDQAAGRVIVAHLGNGASMCAMRGGESVASTMSFTALDGLAMSTRCGQLDPGVLLYMLDQEGLTSGQIAELLYKDSGLKALSGISGDMRVIEEAGTPEADQAIAYFVSRIRQELGGMAAILGGLDALVFCGGIGENGAGIRERICRDLEWLGLRFDPGRNRDRAMEISAEGSQVKVLVIPTNEELMIVRHTLALWQKEAGPA